MEEKKRKFPLSVWEIVLLAIILPVIFFVAVIFLVKPINEGCPPVPVQVGIVLGFNAIWFSSVYLPTYKYRKLKMIISAVLLTLSVAVAACWMLLYSWRNMW